MQARIFLPILSALGLATGLLAALPPQDPMVLREHELDGCEVTLNPIGQRKPPLTVMFEDDTTALGNLIAEFNVQTMVSSVANITDIAAAALPNPLVAGKDYKLKFTYDQGAKAVDVVLLESGTQIATWDNTPVRGTFDRLGPLKEAYSENVRHPTDATKKAMRVWFDNLGLQGGFLLVSTVNP